MKNAYSLVRRGEQVGIHCIRCRLTSWNPYDVANRFCGSCHRFHRRRAGDDENIPLVDPYDVRPGQPDPEALEWKNDE